MIYMWQETKGEIFYRFQTENRDAANKMKRREKFKLVGTGYNCSLWIFQARFTRPIIARKALKTLAGSKVEFNEKEEIYLARINMTGKGNLAA